LHSRRPALTIGKSVDGRLLGSAVDAESRVDISNGKYAVPDVILSYVEFPNVTIDKTLRRKGRLARSRNVLKRAERIDTLEKDDRWVDGQSPYGLPKVRVLKAVSGKKKKKKAKEEGEEDDTATKE
jgi:small basic protein (TIGR04137 family)